MEEKDRCQWTTRDDRTGVILQCILDLSDPRHCHKLDWTPVRERRYHTDPEYHAMVYLVGRLLWLAFHPEQLLKR